MEWSTIIIVGAIGIIFAALFGKYRGNNRESSDSVDNGASFFGNIGTMGDIEGNDIIYRRIAIVNNSIRISEEYNKLRKDINDLRLELKKGSLPPEIWNEKAEELAVLINREQSFEEDVYGLYETFTRIGIYTERLKKAKKYFEKGRFLKADAILNAEELKRDQIGFLEAKDRNLKEIAAIDKDLENNANEYLIKAKLTLFRYDLPDRFEQSSGFFKESVRSFKTSENLFEYAMFLYHNKLFKDAEPLYKDILDIYRKLASKAPETFLPYVASILNNLGILDSAKKDFAKALESYKESLEIYRELASKDPEAFLPYVADTLINLGVLYSEGITDKDKSMEYAKEALEILGGFDENKVPDLKKYIKTGKWILESGGGSL